MVIVDTFHQNYLKELTLQVKNLAKKKQTVKRKGVFDYLKQITKFQKKGFWESLSDEDKKGWSTFLVNRFLSMRSDFLPIVNEVQKYSLKPELIYKTYMDIIPKGNYYLRYIKGKKKKNMKGGWSRGPPIGKGNGKGKDQPTGGYNAGPTGG